MKADITIGVKYGKAVEITEPAEARKYFEECVQHTMATGKSRSEAEAIERANIGYYAGYCDKETMVRVRALYGAKHPVVFN